MKSPDAFRTISEVAEELDVPQHVLRFWETRFSSIRPLKRGGGRRYYRPDDVDLLRGIRHLLYGQGYTIKGVQRILKEKGIRFVQAVGRGEQAVTSEPHDAAAADEVVDVETGGDRVAGNGPDMVPDDQEGELASTTSDVRPRPNDGGPSDTPSGSSWSRSDAERLASVLHELLECERLLEAVRVR